MFGSSCCSACSAQEHGNDAACRRFAAADDIDAALPGRLRLPERVHVSATHQADQHSRDRLRGFDARRRLLRARTLSGDRGEYLQTGRVRAERHRVPRPRLDRGRTEHIELLRIRPLRQRQPRQPSPTAERATLDRPSRSRRLCLLSLRLSTVEAGVLIVSCREVRSVKYRSIRRAAAL
jgi:hypothetical protein